jgi:exonuclease SbcD
LLQEVKAQGVDAIIVAGDIFDTGTPPSYARALYNRFVVELQPLHCSLVIVAGNHDSVATLNESKQLFAHLNTHLIADVQPEDPEALRSQIIELKKLEPSQGEAKNPVGAIVCAVPFLRPRDIQYSLAGQSPQQKQQGLQQSISDHYASLFKLAQERVAMMGYDLPIIMTGHLTTVGVTASDSVRDIYIGTLDAFPANAFPAADYIALGHIHRSQCIAKTNHIRYSGSPIPLSFDECHRPKSINLLEFSAGALEAVHEIQVPIFQAMKAIKGDFNAIENQLAEFVEDDGLSDTTWLDIEVSSQEYLTDLQSRIQTLCEGKAVEVLVVRRSRIRPEASIVQEEKETLAELNVQQVFERRLACEEGLENDSDPQLSTRLRACFEQVLDAVATDGPQDKMEVCR